MRHRRSLVAASAAAFCFCAQSLPAGAPGGAQPVDGNDLKRSLRNEVMETVESARGLRFKEAIRWRAISADEFRAAVKEKNSNGIAAFYDSDKKELVVMGGADFGNFHLKPALIHESIHALQDQVFDLTRLRRNAPTTDESEALRTLVEGDATFTVMSCCLPPDRAESILATDIRNPWRSVEMADLFLEYAIGTRLVKAVKEKSGWGGVNALYAGPPLSTEQCLHPEKYFSGERPAAVSIPTAAQEIGGGWRLRTVDTLGEFRTLRRFLRFESTIAEAADLAAGWGGDAMYTYENGDKTFLLQKIVWDTAQDAEAAFEGAQRLFSEQHSGLAGRRKSVDGNAAFVYWTNTILLDGVYWDPSDNSTTLFFSVAAEAVPVFFPNLR